MEETQDDNTTILISSMSNTTIHDEVPNKSISVSINESEPSTSNQANLYDNLFDQLKENNKHIFVLSTAGKPIYTR